MNLDPSILALIVFAITYTGFFTIPKWRGSISMIGAAAILGLGLLPLGDANKAIPWTVLAIFVGVLFIAEALMLSKLPEAVSEWIVAKSPNAGWALLLLCLASSFLSIFIENVACVLIMAPLGITISRRLGISPIYPIIGIAVSSNLQGCATLIGDPPSMLLAAELNLSFNQFFWYLGKPGIFWAVQVGALTSFIVLYFFFSRYNAETPPTEVAEVKSWIPCILLGVLILGLSILSLIHGELTPSSGILTLVIAALSVLWIQKNVPEEFWPTFKRLDFQTFFFLLGSFIVVAGLEHHEWLERFAHLIEDLAGPRPLLLFAIIILVSICFSAIVANEPYLIAMLPVVAKLALAASGLSHESGIDPSQAPLAPLYYFGLLLGASLGGNITPVGAAACVVAYGILKKEKTDVGFSHFFKLGIPFTLAAVGGGCVFLWIVWYNGATVDPAAISAATPIAP